MMRMASHNVVLVIGRLMLALVVLFLLVKLIFPSLVDRVAEAAHRAAPAQLNVLGIQSAL
jgi:hypothetical protein